LRSSYYWDFGDGNTSLAKNPVHIYKKAGKYTVKFRVTDTASCNKTDSMTLEVEVLEGVEGEILVETVPCSGKINLEVKGTGFDNPEWNLGDGNAFTGAKLSHSYASGQYNLSVVLVNPISGCRDTLKKPLQVNSDSSGEIKLANVFTPNTDGFNDCYRVVGLSPECDKASLKIFNRWGERIYFSEDVLACWNGRVDNTGVEVPTGTYFYQIKIIRQIDNKEQFITGSINLIRN
jgi:gliding motility-associated-like protein